jgi:hypothetical protein
MADPHKWAIVTGRASEEVITVLKRYFEKWWYNAYGQFRLGLSVKQYWNVVEKIIPSAEARLGLQNQRN